MGRKKRSTSPREVGVIIGVLDEYIEVDTDSGTYTYKGDSTTDQTIADIVNRDLGYDGANTKILPLQSHHVQRVRITSFEGEFIPAGRGRSTKTIDTQLQIEDLRARLNELTEATEKMREELVEQIAACQRDIVKLRDAFRLASTGAKVSV